MGLPITTYLNPISASKKEISLLMDRKVFHPDSGTLVIRKMLITDISKLYHDLLWSEEQASWKNLTIIADEIICDKFAELFLFKPDVIKDSITILARKIHNKHDQNLFISVKPGDSRSVAVNLFVHEYIGPPIEILRGRQSIFSYPDPTKVGIKKTVTIGPKKAKSSKEFSGLEVNGKADVDNYFTLMSIFQNAFNTISTAPLSAINSFNWVHDNASTLSRDSKYQNLSIRAAAMSLKLQRQCASGASYVPLLGFKRYKVTLEKQVEYGKYVEKRYENFITAERSYDKKKQDIQQLILKMDEKKQFTSQSIFELKAKLVKAESDLESLNYLSGLQLSKIEIAKKEYEQKIRDEAAAEGIKTLLTVAQGIGKLATGNPGGVLDAIKAAGELSELIEQLKKVYEAMSKIYELFMQVKEIYDLINTNPDTEKTIQMGKIVNSNEPIKDYEWTILKTKIDIQFKPIAKKNTQGKNYLECLYNLITYGQSVNTCTTIVADLQGEILSLMMKQKLYDSQKARLKGYFIAQEKQEHDFREAAILMQQSYLDVKLDVIRRLNDFNDAYKYWGLRDSDLVKIGSRTKITQMAALATGLEETINNGLTNLFGTKESAVFARISIPLDAEAKQTLNNGEKLWQQIKLDEDGLGIWNRVRMQTVEVYLKGLPIGTKYYVILQSSGNFQDRLPNQGPGPQKRFMFVMENTQVINFSSTSKKLTSDQGITNNTIENDSSGRSGGVSLQSDQDFPAPTLFTNWSIRLQDSYINLDLTQVTHIQLIFRGKALGSYSMI